LFREIFDFLGVKIKENFLKGSHSFPINKKISGILFLEKLIVKLNREISSAQRSCEIHNQLMWFQIVHK
jgi:hypothetical protein